MEDLTLALAGVHHLQTDLQASIVDNPVVSVLQNGRVLRDKPPGQHPHSQGRLPFRSETHNILFFLADPVR